MTDWESIAISMQEKVKSLEADSMVAKSIELRNEIADLQTEVDRLKDEIRYRDGMKALENQAQPPEKDDE